MRKRTGYGIIKDIVRERDKVCRYCGRKPKRPTMDHVIPFSKGGTCTVDNLVLACWDCNQKKGAQSLEAFLDHRSSP